MVYFTTLAQAGLVASTISPTCGGAGRLVLVGGDCGGARLDGMSVVRLPERAKAAYTFDPLLLTSRARGFSPKTEMLVTSACVVASKTAIRFLRAALTKA